MREDHVNVTLVAGVQRMDLRIPTRVTVARLIGELAGIVPGVDVPVKFQARVAGKGLVLEEEDVVGDFPVSDGDVIELV